MLRKVCALLCSVIILVGVTAGAAAAHTPAPGALFNQPRGTHAARYRILSNIIGSINSAPAHSTIRFAAYSFDRKDVADALVSACDRHVAVQMVLNDNWTSYQTQRLRKRFNGSTTEFAHIDPRYDDRCNPVQTIPIPPPTCADPADPTTCTQPPAPVQPKPYAEPSFVKICSQSCRGGAGNQHMKFYMFSQAGATSNVTMVGSANLTGYGAVMQWNDMYTVVRNKGIWDLYSTMFRQLAQDHRVAKPYLVRTVGDLESRFSPHPDTTVATDPMMRRLNKVRCRAASGTGSYGRTVIRILMYGWQGDRGLYLANKVANLRRHGCNVAVILSSPGHQVVGALKRGGVLVKSADLNLNGRLNDGFENTGYELFTHEKWMILSGGYGSTSSRNVWTGSENWSNLALKNDEVNLRIPRRGAYGSYISNFNYIWAHWSRWL